MENNCKYCNWWSVINTGEVCYKCGKKWEYTTEPRTYGDIRGTYAEYSTFHEPDAVHNWFGLSYASYLALPRAILQHMPNDWQNRFVECLEELSDAVEFDDNYSVNLRDKKGRFKKDPLANYKRFPKESVPWRRSK